MMLATQTTRNSRTQPTIRETAARRGPAIGVGMMRPIRRAAFRLLDLRTEFLPLPSGVIPEGSPGRSAGLGLGLARQVRRFASRSLDLWTEFDILD